MAGINLTKELAELLTCISAINRAINDVDYHKHDNYVRDIKNLSSLLMNLDDLSNAIKFEEDASIVIQTNNLITHFDRADNMSAMGVDTFSSREYIFNIPDIIYVLEEIKRKATSRLKRMKKK